METLPELGPTRVTAVMAQVGIDATRLASGSGSVRRWWKRWISAWPATLTTCRTFVNYLPQILGALVVLVVGYIIAKTLDKVITKLLRKTKLDARLTSSSGGQFTENVGPGGSPARLVGGVVIWVIMLFVIASAIGTLNIPALTGFMNLVLSYLPNVLAALLIFIVAAAGAVGGLAHRTMGDTATGRVVRSRGPALVMAIAIFMILTQLGIAPVIVTATYIALIGAIALARRWPSVWAVTPPPA